MFPMRTKILTILGARRRTGDCKRSEDDRTSVATATSYTKRRLLKQTSRYNVKDPVKPKKTTKLCPLEKYWNVVDANDRVHCDSKSENSFNFDNVQKIPGTCFTDQSESLEDLKHVSESTEMEEYMRICGAAGVGAQCSRSQRTGGTRTTAETVGKLYENTGHLQIRSNPDPAKFARRKRIQATAPNGGVISEFQTPQKSLVDPTQPGDENVKRYPDDYVVILPSMGTTVKEMKRKAKVHSVQKKRVVRRCIPTPPKFHSLAERCKFYWDSNLESDSDWSSEEECCSGNSKLKLKSFAKKSEAKHRSNSKSKPVNAGARIHELNVVTSNELPVSVDDSCSRKILKKKSQKNISPLVDYSLSDTESFCCSRDWNMLGTQGHNGTQLFEDEAMESFMNSQLVKSDSDEGLSSMNSEDFNDC